MAGLSRGYSVGSPRVVDQTPTTSARSSTSRTRVTDVARDAVSPLTAYLEEAAEVLTVGRRVRGRRRQLLRGALRHAVALPTWRSLAANGIRRSDAARLVTALVERAATP